MSTMIPKDGAGRNADFAARMLQAAANAESFARATEKALAVRASCGTTASDGATVRPSK